MRAKSWGGCRGVCWSCCFAQTDFPDFFEHVSGRLGQMICNVGDFSANIAVHDRDLTTNFWATANIGYGFQSAV